MRKDYFDEHFQWLCSEGVAFDNAWSTSHWTVPAHTSLFTGLYASEVGTHAKNRTLQPTVSNLAELLSDAGYRTRGLTANTSAGPEFDFGQGFDEYQNTLVRSNWNQYVDQDSPWIIRYANFLVQAAQAADTSTVVREAARSKVTNTPLGRYLDDGASRTLKWVRKTDFSHPEFLFLNLMETHSPYDPPATYQSGPPSRLASLECSLNGPVDDEQTIRGAYDDSARYLSDKYRAIHETLTEDFDYIITVGDHGEAFGEYGAWGHTVHLSPEITNVPLIISGPALDLGADRITTAVNLLDVYQTVCDITGITPPDHTRGSSLLGSLPDDRWCYLETHGLTFNEQDIMDRLNIDQSSRERYDKWRHAVATASGYAFEHLDGSMVEIGDVPDAHDRIQEIGNSIDEAEVRAEATDLPDHIQNRLKNLGYV